MREVRAMPSRRPMRLPKPETDIDSDRKSNRISDFFAPMAFLIPISDVRSETEINRTFIYQLINGA